MKKFSLQIEVLGDNSVVWNRRSGVVEGDDAENILDGLENPDPNAGSFSFYKSNGDLVFLPKAIMDCAIVTLQEAE